MRRFFYNYQLTDGSKGVLFIDAPTAAQAIGIASHLLNKQFQSTLKMWSVYNQFTLH